jgi:hypothetical protein
MVYHTQNYWRFGLYALSGILESRKQDAGRSSFRNVAFSSSQNTGRWGKKIKKKTSNSE